VTAKIDMVEPEEDDPKTVFITLDNSGADHCFAFVSGVPKPSLGSCKAGKTVTATGQGLRAHGRLVGPGEGHRDLLQIARAATRAL
jgi:hypothetical protein